MTRPALRQIPSSLQLMILLAKIGGMTDRAAARGCRISERTLRRELHALAVMIGVGSRVELYVEAARRGWLDLEISQLMAT